MGKQTDREAAIGITDVNNVTLEQQGRDMRAGTLMDKYPLTIRLDDELLKVVKAQAALTRSSLGSVVVDAARQALMPEYREKQEQTLLKAMDRCFNRLVKVHEDQQSQHELVREMLAMFVRTFFRHTPAVKPEHQDKAWASAANDLKCSWMRWRPIGATADP
jgi:uncharacterized protein (DUF1778 family)